MTAGQFDSSTGYGVGDLIAGRYLIRTVLGRGGMGAVYEVEHVQSGQRLALKTLYARFGKVPEVMRRFEREAKATNLLSHPNIVEVLDFGALDNGAPFLVMEVLRGKSLGDLIDLGPVEPARALRIIRQILDALAHAHAVGIVHRDLKPDNVMLVADKSSGVRDFVKLLDFGIAKVLGEAASEVGSETLTAVGTAFGTPEYMAPEQALGVPADARADLYAIGILLFETLIGRQPFRGPDPMTVARMQVHDRPPTLHEAAPEEDWPEALEHIVERALRKLPDERFVSAEEMIVAVDAVLARLPGGAGGSAGAAAPRPVQDPGSSAVTAVSVEETPPPEALPTAVQPQARAAAAARRQLVLPRRPGLLVRLGVPLLIVAAVAAAVITFTHRGKPAAPGGGAGAAPVAAPAGPRRSDLAQRAERLLDQGDVPGAAKLLEGAPADDAYAQFLLGRARTVLGASDEAMKAYAQATALEPSLLTSKILHADLKTVLSGKDRSAALAALELAARVPADDLIVEQASSGKLAEVRARARALARQHGVATRVDDLASYSLDLEQGANCLRRREAVRKLRTLGRKEAIPALKSAAELRPNACLAKEALAAVKYLEGLK